MPASFAACGTCHNGITASGKQPQHLATVQDCSNCHNTLNWTITRAPPTLKPLLMIRRGATGGPTK